MPVSHGSRSAVQNERAAIRSPLKNLCALCVFVVKKSALALPRVRIHRRHRRDRHDILDIVTRLQDVHGRAHAQQDRSNRISIRQAREQLVGDIRRVQIGEDQHIRILRTLLKG